MAHTGKQRVLNKDKVSLVGHSFIRRLRDDIMHGHHTFECNLGIDKVLVRSVCKGGWQIEDIKFNLTKVVAQDPHIIILQCGGNDLSSTKNYDEVACQLLETAVEAREASGQNV